MPRQLLAGAMDGQVGTESTGVCGPEDGGRRSEHAAHGPAIAVDPRPIGWRRSWTFFWGVFFWFLLLTSVLVKMRQIDKLAGGGRFFRPGAGTDL